MIGKGDVISCDYKSLNHIPKANSDLTVHMLAEIHSIDYEDLLECLRAYPVFGETFFQRLEVSYSLQEYENVSITALYLQPTQILPSVDFLTIF